MRINEYAMRHSDHARTLLRKDALTKFVTVSLIVMERDEATVRLETSGGGDREGRTREKKRDTLGQRGKKR